MPLSPPSLNISVLRAVQNTTATGAGAGEIPAAEPGWVCLLSCLPSLSISSHFPPGLYSNRCEGLCSACSGAELPLTCGEGQPLFGVGVVVCDHTDQ